MKRINILRNPYLLFSPFLIVLIALVLVFPSNGHRGDESVFIYFANNILNGFYSPVAPDIDLRYPPGYPLLLVPFLALDLPLFCAALVNAFLFYFSMVLLYKILATFVSLKLTLIISLFWACYVNAYQYVPLLHTETLTLFLVTLIAYFLVRAFRPDNHSGGIKYLLCSGFLIGYLALTKPIFGYVTLTMLFAGLLLWITKLKDRNYKRAVIILLIAFTTTLPYLLYTSSLTGRIFFWSDLGGSNLYWMSTPYEKEYGDYYGGYGSFETDSLWLKDLIPGGEESRKLNHRKSYEEILKYKGIEADDVQKKLAVENIKSHSIKFIQNCICNVGRILFDFPYSYREHKPIYLIRFPFNGTILVIMLICLIPTLLNWKKIPFSVRFLLFFALIYFGGSILGSAETRMFTPIVPILLIWIAYMLEKTITFKLKID